MRVSRPAPRRHWLVHWMMQRTVGVVVEPLRAGDPRQVGPYRLAARLGSGGMGRVYLGFSPAGRAVAVKVIRPELARDQGFVRRFRREVAAARQVNGLYTATVVDAGEDPPWLATAFVPGPSLAETVEKRGALAEDAVWRLAAGLAEALVAVHDCGLVHRDLKPANVLLAADGPRVIDFGIAKALEGTALTGTGLAVGTPGFMSPEQAEGEQAGPVSDVFSLGSVLAYAVTGAGPFGGGQPAAVIYRITHTQPALGAVPGPLRSLIADCLARNPAHRPTSAQLMDTITARPAPPQAGSAMSFWPPDLTQFISSYQADLAVPPPGSPEATSAEVTDASGASAASYEPTQEAAARHPQRPARRTSAGRFPGPSPAPGPGEASAPARRPPAPAQRRMVRRITVALGAVTVAAVTAAVLGTRLSPHHAGPSGTGSSQPPHHAGASAPGVSVTLVRTLTDPRSLGITSVTAVAFSPDGKTLAVGDGDGSGRTDLWDLATGRRTATLTDPRSLGITGRDVSAVAFSPDGKTLATGDLNDRTYLWHTATWHRTAVLVGPGYLGDFVSALAFSPGGRLLATGYQGYGDRYTTDLWDTATGRRARTLTGPRSRGLPAVTAVAFSPDGKTLATGYDNGKTDLWDAASGRRARILTGPRSQGVQAVTAVAFSPDGKLLAVGYGPSGTYLWDAASGRRARILTSPGSPTVTAVAFSPDGRTLVAGDGDGGTDLWDTASWHQTGAVTDPGTGGGGVTAVAFSPDGKTLATGDGNGATYLWAISG